MPEFNHYRIGDLFRKLPISPLPNGTRQKLAVKVKDADHTVPLVAAKLGENGVMYWGNAEDFQIAYNCIAVVYDGAVSAGSVYPHEGPVGVNSHSYLIEPIDIMPFPAIMFISTTMQKVIYPKYSREHPSRWDKVQNEIIALPVTQDQQLDLGYMIQCISKIKAERLAALDTYLNASGLGDRNLTEQDMAVLSASSNKRTKSFRMGDLFVKLPAPYCGHHRKQDSVSKVRNTEFCIPLVNCKFGSNGIMYYGRENEFTCHKNVLSVIYNGPPTEGQTYFQEEAGIYTDAYLLGRKDGGTLCRETGLFLATAINKSIHNEQNRRYSRGNKATWEHKVEDEIIVLPVTDDGQPDYEYMYNYIRAQQKITIADMV